MCMKYEPKILMFYKYIAWIPFLVWDVRTCVRMNVRTNVVLYAPIMNDGRITKIQEHGSQIARAKDTLNLSHDGHQFYCNQHQYYSHIVGVRFLNSDLFD